MTASSLLMPPLGGSYMALFGALAVVCLVCYAASAATAWFRLRQFPGPPLASFSYAWALRKTAGAQMDRTVTGLHARYGPVVRIGPNELLTYDAETLWRINGSRSPYSRGPWYGTMKMDPYGHNLFSEPDTAVHDKQRAAVAGGFTGRGRMNLERDVDSQLEILVDLVKRKYVSDDGTKLLDLGYLVRYFAIDVTALVGFGESWGDLKNDTDTFGYLKAVAAFGPIVTCISMVPMLRRLFTSSLFLRLALPKPTDETGLGRVLGVAKESVRERFDPEKPQVKREHEDILDTWIRNGVNSTDCEASINLLIPAGAETVSTVIRGTLMNVLAAPVVYRKLKDEIARGIRESRISSPITNNEAKDLPYLQAVIAEGIRMVPPVTLGFPKRVPPEGDTIMGKFVPGGTDIFVNMYSLFPDPNVFGSDTEIFRPERFLDVSKEKKALLYKHIDLIFGYGRWSCLGKVLAVIELNKIFVELLRRFDFQLANPEKPWIASCSGASWTIGGLMVRVMDGSLGD